MMAIAHLLSLGGMAVQKETGTSATVLQPAGYRRYVDLFRRQNTGYDGAALSIYPERVLY
jgi:hypothetical protein